MQTHKFQGQRTLRIGVRTLHIGATSMVLGAATFGGDPGAWGPAAMATGLLLVADDLYRYRAAWLRFAQAWVVLAKLALLGWGLAVPDHALVALWGALIAGGVISHAPGAVRQFALWGEPGPCAQRCEAPVTP